MVKNNLKIIGRGLLWRTGFDQTWYKSCDCFLQPKLYICYIIT